MKQVNKVGRPSENRDNRARLITSARELFVEQDYDKVSLREIAKKAQVDSALIRYYFQSKLGLFMAMLKETAAPVTEQLSKANQNIDEKSSELLMMTYYRVMSENPDFPKLMFKIASTQISDKNIDFQNILDQVFRPKHINLFASMQQQGLLKDGVDPLCAQISFFSMMIFPFLIPDRIKNTIGIKITPEFMLKLGQQNVQLLQFGCLNTPKNNPIESDK